MLVAKSDEEREEEGEAEEEEDVLAEYRHLKGLSLRGKGDDLTGSALREFWDAVVDAHREADVTGLIYVDFRGGSIGRRGEPVEGLAQILRANEASLQCIDLGSNGLCANFQEPGLRLTKALPSLTQLRALDLSRCALLGRSKGRCRVLMDLMKSLGKLMYLTTLNLQHNDLHSEAICIIGTAVPKMPSLRRLDISGNPLTCSHPGESEQRLTSAGVLELAKGLQQSLSLQILRAKECSLHDFVESLCTAFSNHASIRSINLTGNNISSASSKQLANLIRSSGSLVCLRLAHNAFEETGVEALAYAFAASPCIEVLDMEENGIDFGKGDLPALFEEAALRNINSKAILLRGNPNLSENSASRIRAACSAHQEVLKLKEQPNTHRLSGPIAAKAACFALSTMTDSMVHSIRDNESCMIWPELAEAVALRVPFTKKDLLRKRRIREENQSSPT